MPLGEAAARLGTAHPNRTMYLIVAVGWKCMTFIWDPTNIITGQPQLFIRSAVGAQSWQVDSRFRGIRSESWISLVTGEISTSRAMVLDCWSTGQDSQGQTYLQNWANLATIERFLVDLQGISLQGQNPVRF